ncbi:MAG: EAL domain-containing protein [Chloroflexi bacterium]|nr:EAL domain-containing protein [Chloroflexota bacterium]
MTTFIWYAVGMVPVQIAAVGQFNLPPAEVSSWIFIIWATGAVASIALSLIYRQPIPITSTIPGLLFMATLAGSYSYPELLGANLLAGVLIVLLGVTGIGGRLLEWLPMPLAMGMLGGSILGDVSKAVNATVGDAVVAGATVVGYLLGRTIRIQQIPPVGLALVSGAAAVLLTRNFSAAPVSWQLPSLVMPSIELTFSSFMAVSVPMVVLSMGLGNVQGLGFLRGQGYRVPVNIVTIVLGINSIVNAIFGGHAAIVSRNGMPIMASAEAGPVGGRYWANLVSAGLTLIIAVAAYPVASMLSILPASYVLALAGVAILPSFQSAVEQAFSGKLRFGAVVAFVIACTPFSLFGVSSAFWALIGGLLASLIAERTDLLGHWRRTEVREERREPRVAVDLRPSAAYQISGRRRTPILAQIRNISDNGLSALSEQQLSPGDQLELTFRLPDGEIDVSVRVDVRHVDHLQDGPIELWEAGCEFRAGTPNARERLAGLLNEQPEAKAAAPAAAGTGPAAKSARTAPTPLRPPVSQPLSTPEVRAELIRAIAKDEFRVHYQPIISFETQSIIEMEALLRWEHPERGLVEPSRFLPIAEQTGLIVSLGQRAIEQACRQVREWQLLRGDAMPLGLAVNLSAQQLQHPELVEDLAQALWYSHLDPGSLSLEFNESSLLDGPDLAEETLRRLKHLGVRLVLDDFGTGSASLRRLSQLPLDAVKIDRSLICDVDTDAAQATMVKSIVGAAMSMGLHVTAEGIETWGQQTLLRRMGCQRGQGYFFWSPQPVERIPDLLSPSIPALLGPSARAIPA